MKIKTAASLIAAAVALLAQGAYAADAASAPKSRADVKAETKQAEKEGKLAPAGEGKSAITAPAKTSDTTRPAVKDATKDAAKKGELTPAGEGPTAPKK